MTTIIRLKFAFPALILLTLAFACQSQAPKPAKPTKLNFPEATLYTNDFENVLDQRDEDKLNTLISTIEKETKLQYSVVTLTSKMMGGKDIQQYTLELANYWGVGKKGLNNGIMIAFCKEERKIYIQIGKGIETIYTNNQVAKVIEETITPAFRMGNFSEGIFAALLRITEELKPNLNKIKVTENVNQSLLNIH